jgi:hypothetical protein
VHDSTVIGPVICILHNLIEKTIDMNKLHLKFLICFIHLGVVDNLKLIFEEIKREILQRSVS